MCFSILVSLPTLSSALDFELYIECKLTLCFYHIKFLYKHCFICFSIQKGPPNARAAAHRLWGRSELSGVERWADPLLLGDGENGGPPGGDRGTASGRGRVGRERTEGCSASDVASDLCSYPEATQCWGSRASGACHRILIRKQQLIKHSFFSK